MLRRFTWFLPVVIAILLCAPMFSQGRPFTFEDMMRLKRIGDFTVSPDGHWVVFSAVDVSLKENTRKGHLWIIPTAGGEAHRLTEPGAGTEDRLRFAPDGRHVLYTAVRGGQSQIYEQLFHPETGTLIGSPRPVTDISTEADGALWSPDGKKILFLSSVWPQCQDDACNRQRDLKAEKSPVKAKIFDRLLYRHWAAYETGKRSHLFLALVDCGDVACPARDLTPGDWDVPPFSLGGQDQYAFSPDGHEVAYVSNHDPVQAISTNSDVWTLSLLMPDARPVNLTASNHGSDSTPVYSPDGKYLAIRSQFRGGYESDRFRLQIIERSSGRIINLTEGFDRWVESVAWSADSTHLYITAEDAGDAPIYRLELTPTAQPRLLVRGFNDSPVATSDGRTLVFLRNSARFPNEIFTLSPIEPHVAPPPVTANKPAKGHHLPMMGHKDSDEPPTPPRAVYSEKDDSVAAPSGERRLTHINDQVLAQVQMQPVEWFWFTGAEKKQVEGFLLKPPGFDPGRRYPVKFLIHGGPQGAWGDDWSYRWNLNLFAASGYVVVMINPRGSTGYGQAFVDDINGDWGGRAFEDLMLGLDYAEHTFSFIDKDRECALGASYGGYMANWILGHTDRFKCIVSHDGMFNPESAYGTTEELWFNEWEFKGTPWTNRELYRKWSPALAETNFKTPTLVVHGQLDYRLDVSEGFQLFTALQRQKVPSRMLYFPDEGHWVLKPQNSQLWWKTTTDWVDWFIGTPGKHPVDAPPPEE